MRKKFYFPFLYPFHTFISFPCFSHIPSRVHSPPQIPAMASWVSLQHDRNWLLFACRCYSFPSLKKEEQISHPWYFVLALIPGSCKVAHPRIIRNLCLLGSRQTLAQNYTTFLSIFFKFGIFLLQYNLLCVSQIGLNFKNLLLLKTRNAYCIHSYCDHYAPGYFTHSIEDHKLLAESWHKLCLSISQWISVTLTTMNMLQLNQHWETPECLLVLRKPSFELTL